MKFFRKTSGAVLLTALVVVLCCVWGYTRAYTSVQQQEETQSQRAGENNLNYFLRQFQDDARLFDLDTTDTLARSDLELNNTYGHEEGDKMLRTVACILREIFGEEDSYRIGGDEFVAFALDSTDTELNENMEQFVRQVEEAGYSVAVGTASHSAGGIDIDALVKKAEQRMYLDKSRHYEQLRRGTEE